MKLWSKTAEPQIDRRTFGTTSYSARDRYFNRARGYDLRTSFGERRTLVEETHHCPPHISSSEDEGKVRVTVIHWSLQ